MPVWFKVCLLLCIPHQNQNYEVRKQFSQLCHDFALKIPGASIFSTLPLPDKLVFHIKPDFCTEDRKKRDEYFIFAVQAAVQQIAEQGNTKEYQQKEGQQFLTQPALSDRSAQKRHPRKCGEANAVRRVAETQDQKLRFPHRRIGKKSCDAARCGAASALAAAAEQGGSRWDQQNTGKKDSCEDRKRKADCCAKKAPQTHQGFTRSGRFFTCPLLFLCPGLLIPRHFSILLFRFIRSIFCTAFQILRHRIRRERKQPADRKIKAGQNHPKNGKNQQTALSLLKMAVHAQQSQQQKRHIIDKHKLIIGMIQKCGRTRKEK